jgi:hypothetical protein
MPDSVLSSVARQLGSVRWRTHIRRLASVLVPILLDQQNCPLRVERWLAGGQALELERFESARPECAYSDLTTVVGRPSFSATVGEWLRGHDAIFESARAHALLANVSAKTTPDLRTRRLAFDDSGYHVTFQFGRLKAIQTETVGTGLPCHASDLRVQEVTTALPCDGDIEIAKRTQLAPYDGTVHQYAYTRDFQEQTLRLVIETCEEHGRSQ